MNPPSFAHESTNFEKSHFHGPKTQPIGKLYYTVCIEPFRYHCSGPYFTVENLDTTCRDTFEEFPTENISTVIRFLSIRIKVISLNFENAELVQRH